MINQQVKSHWRIAWASFKRATQVTIRVVLENHRARKHMLKIDPDLNASRHFFKLLPSDD